jgi:hypothetical protein
VFPSIVARNNHSVRRSVGRTDSSLGWHVLRATLALRRAPRSRVLLPAPVKHPFEPAQRAPSFRLDAGLELPVSGHGRARLATACPADGAADPDLPRALNQPPSGHDCLRPDRQLRTKAGRALAGWPFSDDGEGSLRAEATHGLEQGTRRLQLDAQVLRRCSGQVVDDRQPAPDVIIAEHAVGIIG